MLLFKKNFNEKKIIDPIASIFRSNSTAVFVTYHDDAARNYDGDFCKKTLLMIGGKEPFQTTVRGTFVLIGYKGER